MVRKVKRKYKISTFSKGHVIVFGQTGSAKTNLLERIAQMKHLQGAKVISFTFKHEMCQLGFPETDRELVNYIKTKKQKFQVPRGFPNEVLVPFAVSDFDAVSGNTMRIDLPKHFDSFIESNPSAWTHWKPFKLSFEDMNASDFVIFLRKATESGVNILDILGRLRKYNSVSDLIKEMVGLVAGAKKQEGGKVLSVGTGEGEGETVEANIGAYMTYQSILTLLMHIEGSGFLVDKNNPFVLDLDKIMMEKDVMTTINLEFVDEKLAGLIYQVLGRNIIRLRKKKKYPPMVLVLNEYAQWCPRVSSDSLLAVAGVSPKPLTKFFLSQARILGITVLSDTQYPRQIDSGSVNNFKWIAIGRNSKEAVQDIHENIISIPDNLRRGKKLASGKVFSGVFEEIQTGRFGLFELGSSSYQYPFFACPSLAFHRKENMDVLDWIAGQPDVEMVSYSDVLSKTARATMKTLVKIEKNQKTPEEIAIEVEIIKRHKLGISQEKIAKALGVGRSVVRRVLKNLG